MTKNTSTDDDDFAWLDQIIAGENLDADQRLVRDMYDTIERALQNDLDAVVRYAAVLKEERKAGKPIDPTIVEKLTQRHAQILAARDGMFALMAARNHPIHRFVNLTRKRLVKGHYPPSIGEAHYRSLVSAFVLTAPNKLPRVTARKAAEIAAATVTELGVGANTAASIIAWESQAGAYGLLGRDGVNMYCTHLGNIPAENFLEQFKVMLAELRGGDAVSRILEELQNPHPLEN